MNMSNKMLTIEVGNEFVHGNVFDLDGPEVFVNESRSMLLSASPEDVVKAMKQYFASNFDQSEIVGDRITAVTDATNFLSSYGSAIGIRFDSQESIVSYSTYGRNRHTKRYDFGWGKGIGSLVMGGGVEKLHSWFDSRAITNKTAHFNTIGRRMLYPNMPVDRDGHMAISSLVYLMTNMVADDFPQFTLGTALHENPHSVNTIIISGEFLADIPEPGKVILSVIDGMELEGVWQIVFDPHCILTSLSLVNKESYFDVQSLGFELQGTLVTLSHKRDWFQEVGEIVLDFGLSEPMVLTAFSGELVVVPLSGEQSGGIQFSFESDVTIKGYSPDLEIRGGRLGIILDVRGRPIARYFSQPSFASQYKKWEAAI